jgi:hypothetical protein
MHNRSRRMLVSALAIAACMWAAWASGRTAAARALVRYGLSTTTASALDTAVRLTPTDAQGHYGRGALANYLNQPDQALAELEVAVSLRPRDYALWLELGMTRDQLEDTAGALSAFNEAVRLAPFYSKPRWQRGNLLFRSGRYDEAFSDLRNAADSNPGLLPGLIDLAWGAGNHDPTVTEQILQVRRDSGHLALAFFFASHGRPESALTHFGLAKSVTEEKRRDLIQALVAAGAYSQAFAIWHSAEPNSSPHPLQGEIYDGGFERALTFNDTSFGWAPTRNLAGLSLSLDQNNNHGGSHSLRIDFNGESDPDLPIIKQLVFVEPNTHYKLSFAIRTSNIVTGGPPIVVISDATSKDASRIASTAALPKSENWQINNLEFVTGAKTTAVLCSLQREHCTSSPCPIFGALNLDDFTLERINPQSKH